MLGAGEWVRQMVALSQERAVTTETVLKSLEKNVGQGDKTPGRVQAIIDQIDRDLEDRGDSQTLIDLRATVGDYLEKVQEGLAAA